MTLYYTDHKTKSICLKKGEALRWITLYDFPDFKCVFILLVQTLKSNVRQFEHFESWDVLVVYKIYRKLVETRKDNKINHFHQNQELTWYTNHII